MHSSEHSPIGLQKTCCSTVDAGKPKSLTHLYIALWTWPRDSAFVVGMLLANRSIGPVLGINAELGSVFDLFREEEDFVVAMEVTSETCDPSNETTSSGKQMGHRIAHQ